MVYPALRIAAALIAVFFAIALRAQTGGGSAAATPATTGSSTTVTAPPAPTTPVTPIDPNIAVFPSGGDGPTTPPPTTARATTPPVLFGISGGGSVELGQKVTLQVSISGTGTDVDPELTYQWRRNGTALAGATAATYVIEATTAADSATYTIAVTNSAGTSVATTDVTVKSAAAPIITTQPRTTTASVGQTITFSFVATGSFPRTYQWRKDGTPLSGATDASLTLNAITTAQAGAYSVAVANALGSATSSPASLTVNAATPPVVSSSYPFDLTTTQGSSATLSSNLNSGSNPFAYQWMKNGVPITGATNSTLTFTVVALADAGKYSFTVTNPAGTATSREATLTVNPPTPITIFSHPQTQTLFQGQNLNLGISLTGSSPISYQWLKNGVAIAGATNSSFSIGSLALSDAGSYAVAATNAAGSVTSNAAIVTVNAPTVPTITTQPTARTLAFNETLGLNVQAAGSPPLTYVWRKDGVAVANATSSNFFISSATPANNGVYTVVVSNAAGSVTSIGVTVTVTPAVAPTITAQPADRQVSVGLSVSFSASYSSSGAGSVTAQWTMNGVPIAGTNSSSFSIQSVKETDAGSYALVLTGPGGTVTSATARLTVLPPAAPSMTSWRSTTVTATLGTRTSLSVSSGSLSGTPPFSYQWAKNGTPLPGATNATLEIASVSVADYASYSLSIANEGGLITSPAVRLSPVANLATFENPPPTPWLDAARLADTVYFLATLPARIERYDLAGERWLPTVLLSETQVPTAMAVAAEGVYIAYGRALVRRSLDLLTETPFANTTGNTTAMFVFGDFLFYNGASTSSSSSTTFGTINRGTLQTGPGSSPIGVYSSILQVTVAPGIAKGFARSSGSSPSDIVMFSIGADGRFSNSADSPYHGDMPVGSRTIVLPGEQLVADTSGTVYRTANLTFAGSFGDPLTDLAFFPDGTAVILRGPLLSTARTDTFLEVGKTSLAQAGMRVFTRGTNAFIFGPNVGSGSYAVAKVGAAEFLPTTAPAVTVKASDRYSIDDAFVGENNIVHVFSRTLPGFVRWNPATRTFLSPLPLRDSPNWIFHQPGNRRALAHYVDGVVTEIPLSVGGTERPLFRLAHFVRALTDLGDLVSVNIANAGNSGDQRLLMGLSTGPRFINTSLYESQGLAWQASTRRLYSSPAFSSGLQFEVVSAAGVVGPGSAVANTGGTITAPIRFNAEGTLLVSGNGRVLNADLASVGVLANDILDAAWLGNTLYSIRSRNGQTEVQKWARASYLLSDTTTVRGTPVRILRLSETQLLVVSSVQGFLALTIINADLSLNEPPDLRSYAGAYFAKLGTTGDLALYLRPDGTGALLATRSNPRTVLWSANVTLNSDLTFVASARDLSGGTSLTISGALAPDGTFSGSIPTLNMSYSGARAVGSTPAGYYQVPALNGANGNVYAIIGPDGRAVIAVQSGSTLEGGFASNDGTGNPTLTTSTGARLTVAVDANTGGVTAIANQGALAGTTFAGLREGVARTDRLANISTRGRAGPGEDLMIAGFVITGTAPRPVLIRAIGPSLGAFGVPGTLADPRLTLYRGATKLSENDNWSATGDLPATTTRLGGFALVAGSADSALLLTLDPGAYTAQVGAPEGAASGTALVEVYDAGSTPTPGAPAPRLINIATRGRLATADESLIAGIVVTGNAPKRILIRAIGPGLAAFGVPGTLADPVLTLTSPAATGPLASNDDWTAPAANAATASELAAAAVSVGAFALPANSKDACLLLTLAPGNYTAQVTGKNNATGIALVEVYEVNN